MKKVTKKLIALLLAAVLVVSLAACSKSEQTDAQPTGSASEEQNTADVQEKSAEKEEKEDEDGNSQIVNPIVEYDSLEAINAELGVNLCTAGVMGVTDESYAIINCGSYKIAQYKFCVNGYSYCFRAASTTEDISGIYGAEDTIFADKTENTDETVILDDTKAARWFTIDGQYVLSIIDEGTMSEETFAGVVEEFKTGTMTDMANANSD